LSLLGIDVGTTGCKTVFFSEQGKILASAYAEHEIQHPQPGYAELDALHVWKVIKQLITRVVAQAGSHSVRAVSVSSMGEAVVPVTFNREVLAPSILNFDRRGEEFLKGLREKIKDEHLYQINGNTLGNNYSLTKLLWIKQHQPEIYSKADQFLHWSGFVSFMLGADPVVDYSLANRTLLFDLNKTDWSEELIGLTGLDRSKLPRPVPSGTLIGKVNPELAGELGLPGGVEIVAGAHDQNATAIGCGVIQEGQAVFGMGTFTCITPVYRQRKEPLLMLARGLNTEHAASPGSFVSFIYNQGGALLKWYRDTFGAADKKLAAADGKDIYTELVGEIPETPSDIFVLPHFMQTGPPEFIANSSGVILGLKTETKRGEILKGLLEGDAFYLKECIDTLPSAGIQIREYRVVGGGSKSNAWIQLNADILGAPFIRPVITEAGALGAAITAGVGTGIFASFEEGVDAMVNLERSFEQEPRKQAHYIRRYEHYKHIWPLMKDFLTCGEG
jgi:xylulokinase